MRGSNIFFVASDETRYFVTNGTSTLVFHEKVVQFKADHPVTLILMIINNRKKENKAACPE